MEFKFNVDHIGQISDGYHTFDELYYHRMMLFSVICNQNKEHAWKSKLHHDNTMYDVYFIVGITTPEGDFTYHYHLDHWDMFDVKALPNAPKWDGHKSEDITRLLSLKKLDYTKKKIPMNFTCILLGHHYVWDITRYSTHTCLRCGKRK